MAIGDPGAPPQFAYFGPEITPDIVDAWARELAVTNRIVYGSFAVPITPAAGPKGAAILAVEENPARLFLVLFNNNVAGGPILYVGFDEGVIPGTTGSPLAGLPLVPQASMTFGPRYVGRICVNQTSNGISDLRYAYGERN
jgi:hypothetical protein